LELLGGTEAGNECNYVYEDDDGDDDTDDDGEVDNNDEQLMDVMAKDTCMLYGHPIYIEEDFKDVEKIMMKHGMKVPC